MFCRCENGFGGEPNTQTCPVCLAFPGALPVPNRRAIEETIKLGLALGCEIAPRAVFHRKNYFYPDNPEGVPDLPVRRAALRGRPARRCRRRTATSRSASYRAHLEEDAAKNVHVAASGRIHGATATLVDFNRCGTPLLEIVTEPDIHSADDAEAVPAAAPPDGRRARALGRGAREGLDALRRQRLRAPGRLRRAAHAHRAEEHELVQLRGEGDRARGRAADRRSTSRAATVEQETLHFDPAHEDSPPLRSQGGGAGLPLLPGARPRAGAPARGAGRAAARRGRRSCRAPGSAASPRRSRSTTPTCSSPAGSTGSGRRSSTAGADPKETANVLANAFVATGVDPERGERGRAREARSRARAEIPRAAFDEALAHSGDDGLLGRRRTSRRRRSATSASSTR